MADPKKDSMISYANYKKGFPAEATIPTLFFKQAFKLKNKPLFSFFLNDNYQTISWQEFESTVNYYIDYLKPFVQKKGFKIAILSDNSPEMVAMILAILSLNCICCPIHTNQSTDQVLCLVNEYKYDILVLSNSLKPKFENLFLNTPKNLNILSIDIFSDCVDFKSYVKKESNVISATPDDYAYIMLSSGTSGFNSGIMLTHNNILSNVRQVLTILNMLSDKDIFMGMLPFSHSYGGLAELYTVIYLGAKYHFCSDINLDILLSEFKKIKPTVFQTVPRIWEKLYYHFHNPNNININLIDELGGNLNFGFSAGSFLNLDISKYFFYRALPIYQGYGLTEASPSIGISKPEDPFILNIYKVLPEINLIITEDSEILVQGPNVSKAYYNNKKQSFIDDFLHTGDLAISPQKGFISIIGRKKDLIVLSTAHKVVPDPIEQILHKHPLVRHSVLIGNDRPFISCLIFLKTDPEQIYPKNILSMNDPEYIEIEKYIQKINAGLSNFEKIKKFIIFTSEIEENEITVSQKIIRESVENNRKDIIDQLYLKH